eukprot:5876386-Pyramimonas_sp.AAC.1
MINDLTGKLPAADGAIAVFGGVGGFAVLAVASDLIEKHFASAKVASPLEMFIKSESFNGFVFAK